MSSPLARSTGSRTRRTVTSGLLALALAGGGLALATPASATPDPTYERTTGGNRFETSVQISRATWNLTGDPTTNAAGVVIASGLNFPDGLSASALAGTVGGPVLLVPPSGPLPASTAAEIQRLGVDAYVVGGTAAVGNDVLAQVRSLGAEVTRVSGANRFLTAANVARFVGEDTGVFNSRQTAFLATGGNYADALAASAPAFSGRHPILLTDRAVLSQATAELLAAPENVITQVVILGGSAAVSPDVVAELTRLGIDSVRVSGANRFETATQLAGILVGDDDFAYRDDAVVVATGLNFADALSAGPFAGVSGEPILFAEGEATQTYLTANNETIDLLDVIGGRAAVSDALAEQLVVAATTDAGDTTPPVLVTSAPATGATGVVLDADVSATFDEDLGATSTIEVLGPDGEVDGTVDVLDATIAFDPTEDLLPETAYVATITAVDTSGNAAAPVTISFTTAAAPVTGAPVLLTSTPADGNALAPVTTTVAATFDTALDAASTVVVEDADGVAVDGAVRLTTDDRRILFTPTAELEYATTYTATFTATNAVGTTTQAVTFTTVEDPAAPPVAQGTNPNNGATGVGLNITPAATFDEPLGDASTVTLVGPDGEVPGTAALDPDNGRRIVFEPTGPLEYFTDYTATFAVQDLAGNASTTDVSFRTIGDPASPAIVSSNPANGATGVAVDVAPTATFDRPIQGDTASADLYVGFGPTTVSGDVSATADSLTFTPDAPLLPNQSYLMRFLVAGTGGNGIGRTFSFTTGADGIPLA